MPMRIRSIKPEFYQSETMAQVTREVRDLAKALITWADDYVQRRRQEHPCHPPE